MPSFSRQIRLFSGLEAPLREQIYGKNITAQVMPQFSQCSRVAICSCTTTDTLRLDTIRAFLQKVTASDGWTCRVDVVCVGADLRVRPQDRLRSGEDGRTHRSAPTKGYSSRCITTDALRSIRFFPIYSSHYLRSLPRKSQISTWRKKNIHVETIQNFGGIK